MVAPKNAMEIFKLLDMSNCRQCGEKTCLAFAGAVFQGQRKLEECPKLDREIIERYSGKKANRDSVERNRDEYLKQLKSAVTHHDLAASATRVGAKFSGSKLMLKVLGKDFAVDTDGNLYAGIHINPWVVIPFLSYILHGKGLPVSGVWVSFRELKDGKERYPLFQKRCEEPIKRIADMYTNLFDDLVHMFSAKRVPEQFESDCIPCRP